jgi:DNA invertase Pin-like site-specific DNA recombinase
MKQVHIGLREQLQYDIDENLQKILDKNKIELNQEPLTFYQVSREKKFDNYLNILQNDSMLFVDSFAVLGHSIFCILDNIKKLKDKNITLYIINKGLTFHLQNRVLFNFLEGLLEFERDKIKHKTDMAKQTREKNKTKLGRKKNQKMKSKYDEYKRRILYLHRKGVPNTKIVKDINLGTPQSLGQYIKRLKSKENRKNQKISTHISTFENVKNINDLDALLHG